jgi:outer membrane receptor protein involved in Fe transport
MRARVGRAMSQLPRCVNVKVTVIPRLRVLFRIGTPYLSHPVSFLIPLIAAAAAAASPPPPALEGDSLSEVVVSAERLNLIGTATTSSQGVVVNDELALTPAYRPGQLEETVPGLVVTSHSGEGKANQYLLRGFNLDHGTDLANFIDGMPVNEPTHAHGEGYTDLNFMIPELATHVAFTKGPYFAGEGDFASVGAVHISYLNRIEDQVELTGGTLGFQRLFSAGTIAVGGNPLLGALELQHYEGPWDSPDNQRKLNAVVRLSDGDDRDGYSLSGMFYHATWNATTDQPERAIDAGLISRFGTLDSSDGGWAQRFSLSGQYHRSVGHGQLAANTYYVSNRLTLWNDFTHFLDDPLNGDQEAQHEDRRTLGAAASWSQPARLLGLDSDLVGGVQGRFDSIEVGRIPTKDRVALTPQDTPLGFSETDLAHLSDIGVYVQVTSHWNGWIRSVLGLREDYAWGSDSGTNFGTASQTLLQPKGSLIFSPSDHLELYVSAGRGFHSDDLRGFNQARLTGVAGAPLLARSTGEEIGARASLGPRLTATLTAFRMDFQSETTYDADAGDDSAGPGSRRDGVELNVTYQVRRWLELYGTLATTHARFTSPFDDGTGHIGEHVPNSPKDIASFTAYVKNLRGWSGALTYRFLGRFPLTPDARIRGDGYGELNGDLSYQLPGGWKLGCGVYNILGTHANAAEFWYRDRLRGEPADGVNDLHVHPIEPRTARLTIGKSL